MKAKTDEPKTWHDSHRASSTFGQRLADSVANGMGSWRFIIIQTLIVAAWMILNVVAFVHHWDVYPYILLNLLFSYPGSICGAHYYDGAEPAE